MRKWSREPEKNEASALPTRENTSHKLYIVRMLDTCTVHQWWLAEENVHIPVNFFRAINGRRKKKKQQLRDRVPTAKIEFLGPDSPQNDYFSSILFPLGQHKYYCFNPRCTQKAKVHEQGNCLWIAKITQSDPSLDFSPPSHSSIWSLSSVLHFRQSTR